MLKQVFLQFKGNIKMKKLFDFFSVLCVCGLSISRNLKLNIRRVVQFANLAIRRLGVWANCVIRQVGYWVNRDNSTKI